MVAATVVRLVLMPALLMPFHLLCVHAGWLPAEPLILLVLHLQVRTHQDTVTRLLRRCYTAVTPLLHRCYDCYTKLLLLVFHLRVCTY